MPTPTQTTTNTTPGSRAPVQVDVRSSLNFDAMWKAHPLNWVPRPEPHPFKKPDGFTPAHEDQCAIKMSIALQESGLPLTTFKGATERNTVKGKSVRAALRAEELAKWLISALGKPERSTDGKAMLRKIKDKRGIVFFKDFWTREISAGPPRRFEADENRSGDHLDLWNGARIPSPEFEPVNFNQIDNPLMWWTRYFGKSKEVWFWELR